MKDATLTDVHIAESVVLMNIR